MKDSATDTTQESEEIKQQMQVISKLTERLDKLEEQIKAISQASPTHSSSQTFDYFQKIIMKITSLRELIDKVEIEIDQLNSRMDGIESLRFKHRTES